MSYEVYKIIHLLGLSMVLMSLGGIILHSINGGSKGSNTFRKGAMITHGVGLFLLLVAGFGMLAKLGIMVQYARTEDFKLDQTCCLSIWIHFEGF